MKEEKKVDPERESDKDGSLNGISGVKAVV